LISLWTAYVQLLIIEFAQAIYEHLGHWGI